jgi:acyl-CoA synthetase (AMP-forming)/AMP-acid ligase II
MAVIDHFDRGWRSHPDNVCFIKDDRRWSYDEIGRQSCRIANALRRDFGDQPRHVAVLAANDPAAWTAVLGVWRAGMVWIPLNPGYPPADLQSLLAAFTGHVLFFHERYRAVVDGLRAQLPEMIAWICLDGRGPDSLETWLGDVDAQAPVLDWHPDDVVAIMPTGGTTGVPKGVMNTHRSLATSTTHMMLAFHYEEDEPIVNLAAAPMTHAAGLLLLPVTARGGTIAVIERADAGEVVTAIERYAVTELFLPPTVIYRMLDLPGIDQREFGSLRYFLYGAAPIALDRLRSALRVFGPVMITGYGQMEAPMAVSFLRPGEHVDATGAVDEARIGTVGVPYPLVAVQIQNDDGLPVALDQPGEICVRGDLVMRGYYRNEQATAETIVNGWLHTGDIGRLDEHGYLRITDRKKDMIISGGTNVYPGEVEQVLAAHPGVRECAVAGRPDPDWGEAVTAFVERAEPAAAKAADDQTGPVTEQELISWCKERLGSVRTPKSVIFVDALPKSAVGKVLKKALRDWSPAAPADSPAAPADSPAAPADSPAALADSPSRIRS